MPSRLVSTASKYSFKAPLKALIVAYDPPADASAKIASEISSSRSKPILEKRETNFCFVLGSANASGDKAMSEKAGGFTKSLAGTSSP